MKRGQPPQYPKDSIFFMGKIHSGGDNQPQLEIPTALFLVVGIFSPLFPKARLPEPLRNGEGVSEASATGFSSPLLSVSGYGCPLQK